MEDDYEGDLAIPELPLRKNLKKIFEATLPSPFLCKMILSSEDDDNDDDDDELAMTMTWGVKPKKSPHQFFTGILGKFTKIPKACVEN